MKMAAAFFDASTMPQPQPALLTEKGLPSRTSGVQALPLCPQSSKIMLSCHARVLRMSTVNRVELVHDIMPFQRQLRWCFLWKAGNSVTEHWTPWTYGAIRNCVHKQLSSNPQRHRFQADPCGLASLFARAPCEHGTQARRMLSIRKYLPSSREP